MGYESRIFIVNRTEWTNIRNETRVWGEKIAEIDMSKMHRGFSDLFTKEIDYELCINNTYEKTKTDYYGDVMTYTDCKTVIDYLEELIASGDNYRRLSLLLGLLKGIDERQWEDIQVVHFGY